MKKKKIMLGLIAILILIVVNETLSFSFMLEKDKIIDEQAKQIQLLTAEKTIETLGPFNVTNYNIYNITKTLENKNVRNFSILSWQGYDIKYEIEFEEPMKINGVERVKSLKYEFENWEQLNKAVGEINQQIEK